MESNLKDLDALQDIIIMLDEKFSVGWANQATYDFYHLDKYELINKNFIDLCKKESFSYPKKIEKYSSLEKIPSIVLDKTSNVSWKIIRINETSNHYNCCLLLIGENYSLDKVAVDEMHDVEELLGPIINLLPGNYWWKDASGVYRGCNQEMTDSLGLESTKNIIGKTDYDLPWSKEADMLVKNDQVVMSRGKAQKGKEELVTRNDGNLRVFIVAKSPLRNFSGEVIGTVGNSIDITKQKDLEKRLRETETREARFKAMSALGGMIAHELRTPLAALRATSVGIKKFLPALLEARKDSCSEDALNPMQKDLLESLQRSANDMDGLIDHCQNIISTILTGINYSTTSEAPKLEALSLHSVVQSALANYPFSTEEKALITLKTIDDRKILGNEAILIHVLHNLWRNALQVIYEEGKGQIQIWTEPQGECIALIVEDTAKGIAAEHLKYIFDAFYTTKEKVTQSVGLGLYFSKATIERIGGELICQSELGQYARFVIRVPLVGYQQRVDI